MKRVIKIVKILLGTATTDTNGVATVPYSPKGLGKVNIITQSGDLISEEYTMYDVKFKDMGTDTDYSNWNNSQTTSISRSETDTTVQPNDFTVFGARTVNTNGATVIEFDAKVNVLTAWLSLRQNSASVTNLSQQYLGYSVDEWHHYQIEVDGVQYRAIVDGSEKEWRTMTGSQTYNRFQMSFNQNTGLIIQYKNFLMY